MVKAAAAYGVGQDIGTYVSVISGPSRFDLGESLLDVLEREGVEVITFPDEACCGIPALMSGDESAARKMAAANVKMLSQKTLDQLVFLCPSCASTAKREWPRLLAEDSNLAQVANTLAAQVMDISEYLVKVIKISPPRGKLAKCKWSEVVLTPKAIALGLVQGRLASLSSAVAMSDFVCPVGLDAKGVVDMLTQVKC